MKKIFLLSYLTLSPIILFSQTNCQLLFGLDGGLTYSNIIEKNDFPGNYDFKTGYSAGLNLELIFRSRISLETNIAFYQNGFNNNYRSTLVTNNYYATKSYLGFDYNVTQNYLNNSWLIGYHIGNKFDFSIYAGLYWSLFLKSKRKGKDYIYTDPNEWIEIADPAIPLGYKETLVSETISDEIYTNIDFGLVGKIMVGYNINEKFKIICFMKYYKGLTDIDKKVYLKDVENYNNSVNFGLGFKMKL